MKKIITSCLAMAALAVGVATTLAQQQRVTTTKQKVGQRIETRGQASSRLASLRPSVAFAVTQPEKPAVTSVVVPGANTMFGGLMVYSDKWQTSESTPGVVSIQAREGGAISMVHSNKDMLNVKSAVKVNNIVYATAMNLSTYKIYVQEYSATSWTCTRNEETDMVNLASSLACDPTTGKIYGSFYNTETEYWDRFCSYSTSLGEATDIANMDRDVHALAFNSQGELYGIWGATGWLVKIDKKTGSYVQVGKTGLYPISVDSYGVNSLAFGNDGALYWSATYQGTSSKDMRGGLFKVDTATGKATKVMDYPNNEGIAGLFAMADKVPDAAPDAVSDINVNFTAEHGNNQFHRSDKNRQRRFADRSYNGNCKHQRHAGGSGGKHPARHCRNDSGAYACRRIAEHRNHLCQRHRTGQQSIGYNLGWRRHPGGGYRRGARERRRQTAFDMGGSDNRIERRQVQSLGTALQDCALSRCRRGGGSMRRNSVYRQQCARHNEVGIL